MNKIRIAGAAAGVVLVSGVVLQVSSAAFTDTTENAGNTWEAGTVSLTDGDLGSAMYTTSNNISPGYTETQCIEVTYDGSVVPDEAIDLYAASSGTAGGPDDVAPVGADGDGLQDDLTLTVRMGNAGTTCATFTALNSTALFSTAALDAFNTSAAPLSTGWTPTLSGLTPDTTRAFQFTVALPDAAANDGQGDTATATFTWSATS